MAVTGEYRRKQIITYQPRGDVSAADLANPQDASCGDDEIVPVVTMVMEYDPSARVGLPASALGEPSTVDGKNQGRTAATKLWYGDHFESAPEPGLVELNPT